MTELFRISLFGYSKRHVHAYISEMNEDFSQKMLEKDRACKDTVQALREELERVRRENERLRAERQEVAGALIDAKAFAAGLIERAEEEDRTRRAKNAALQQAELHRLQAFAANIDGLRKAFCSVLRGMDEEMEQYGAKCQAIQTEFGQDRPEGTAEAARQEPRGGQEDAC